MNSTVIKSKEVTEETVAILSNLNREFITKPVPVQHYEPLHRKDTILLIMYVCRGLFIYQLGNLKWSINKDSSYVRKLLSELQQEGLVESGIIYGNKRYYGLTKKGYNVCIEMIERYFMLIGRRESALASLYDGAEYCPTKGATSNILHRILSNDVHIALSSLRTEGLPAYIVRHEVAVSDTGIIYIRNYDNDILCDKNKVALRIDAVFEYADRHIYVEQDTGKQSISVLKEKLNNYANTLFSNNNNVLYQTLIFSVFTGMDITRVIDNAETSGVIPPELKKLIRRYGGILVGICACNHDKMSIKELIAFLADKLDAITMYYGSNSSGQIRSMFKMLTALPHNIRLSTVLAEAMKTEQKLVVDEENRTTIERHYRNRREIIMRALDTCEDIKPFIYQGLSIHCVPNVDGTADIIKLTALSSVPYVYKVICSGLHRQWKTAASVEYTGITFITINAEGANIIIENISDSLSGRLRIGHLLDRSLSDMRASVICVCEDSRTALKYVTRHKRAAFTSVVSRADALCSNQCRGIIFVYYSDLLNNHFEPAIFISGTDNHFVEYKL